MRVSKIAKNHFENEVAIKKDGNCCFRAIRRDAPKTMETYKIERMTPQKEN